MKNALLIINVLLVIAVATLFFLYFSRKAPQLSAAAVNTGGTEQPAFRIAYFEMDSLENNYTYFKEMRELFRAREQKLNTDLEAIKNQYNKLLEETNQAQASLSEEEKMKRSQTLAMLEQSFRNKQEMQGAELQSDGFRYKQQIYKRIQEYLKKYNEEKGYAFILASSNDLLYYKDTVYNITGDLLKGLNSAYAAEKKK